MNYAGFAPVLVEGLKELEQQQQRQRLEGDEAQDEIQHLKEVAQRQQLEMEAWRELSRQQRSELGEAWGEIRSLTELARQQKAETDNLKELAQQLLQLITEQPSRSATMKATRPTIASGETSVEKG